MAFLRKAGSLLGQTTWRQINSETFGANLSVFQIIRCMSTSKIFIGGLSFNTSDQSLGVAFSKYGQVHEARVIIDRETSRSRGFGFVTFGNAEEASAAIQALDGQELDGRTVRVNYANERVRSGGFGGYGGGYGSAGGGGLGGDNYNQGGGNYNQGFNQGGGNNYDQGNSQGGGNNYNQGYNQGGGNNYNQGGVGSFGGNYSQGSSSFDSVSAGGDFGAGNQGFGVGGINGDTGVNGSGKNGTGAFTQCDSIEGRGDDNESSDYANRA